MTEATGDEIDIGLAVHADGLLVGVGRGESHAPGDALHVCVDRDGAGATAGEQQDAVGGLRADIGQLTEERPDLRSRCLGHVGIERRSRPEGLEDGVDELDGPRCLLGVQPGRPDALGEVGVAGLTDRHGQGGLIVAVVEGVEHRLTHPIGGVLAADGPDEAGKRGLAAERFRQYRSPSRSPTYIA